jgi:hypothetical protein
MMKNSAIVWAFMISPLILASCSGGSGNNKTSGTSGKNIVGTWNMNATHLVQYVDGSKTRDTVVSFKAGEYSKITFNADQSYLATSLTDGHEVTEKGTYSFKDGKLATKPSSGVPKPSDAFSSLPVLNCEIQGNTMVLSVEQDTTLDGKQRKFDMTTSLEKEGST